MNKLALALAALALCAPAMAQEHTGADDTTYIRMSPDQLAQIYCIAMTGNDFAFLETLVSPDLKAAITEAEAKDDAYAKANPGDMPPLGDGIPWQGAPDYAPGCTVGAIERSEKQATIAIARAFPDYPAANFVDKLQLALVPDAEVGESLWRIDDVMYADQTTLRQALKAAFLP